ncbi:hypothetical protein M3Y97_00986100 [Aphelenchoides bicaudatus]|nr:hypothetical protein M3Y97_00986100 [Aphelenchoides bicaudatus]
MFKLCSPLADLLSEFNFGEFLTSKLAFNPLSISYTLLGSFYIRHEIPRFWLFSVPLNILCLAIAEHLLGLP